MKRRLSVTNLSSENDLQMFRLNAPVVIKAKVKKYETNTAIIAMHLRLQRTTEYSTIHSWIYYSKRKTEAKYSEAERPTDSRSCQPTRSTLWGQCHAGSKPPVAPVTQRKVPARSSARCWKLRPSSENYWTPSQWESRVVTPPIWPWFDAQRGVADVGTQQQTLVWPGCKRTVGGLLRHSDMARWRFSGGTFRTTTYVR